MACIRIGQEQDDSLLCYVKYQCLEHGLIGMPDVKMSLCMVTHGGMEINIRLFILNLFTKWRGR
jgi:hypothetical protein